MRLPSPKTLAAGMAAGGALVALVTSPPRPPAPPPDVVFVVIDALRADRLPFYGYRKDTAPFLASLAASGVVFDQAFATSSWTAPSMASIFTGLYPFQHGVVLGFGAARRAVEQGVEIGLNRLPEQVETLPQAFRRAGYATFAVTDNVNVGPDLGFDAGFDRFVNYPRYRPAEDVAAAALRWEDELTRRRPHLLYLHFIDTHQPVHCWDEWFAGFDDDPDAREQTCYDTEIAYADAEIAELAERLGWLDHAVIVVTADHGEEQGDHGGEGHSETLFSEVLRVPLLVRLPGGGPSRRVSEPVSHVDLLPTLRELAGLPASPLDAGVSLMDAIRGIAPVPAHRPLFAHLDRHDRQGGQRLRATLQDGYKLIWAETGRQLLFRLEDDPGDRHDLAAEQPDVVRRLRSAYESFERSAPRFQGEVRRRQLDPATLEHLRTLGYVQ